MLRRRHHFRALRHRHTSLFAPVSDKCRYETYAGSRRATISFRHLTLTDTPAILPLLSPPLPPVLRFSSTYGLEDEGRHYRQSSSAVVACQRLSRHASRLVLHYIVFGALYYFISYNKHNTRVGMVVEMLRHEPTGGCYCRMSQWRT